MLSFNKDYLEKMAPTKNNFCIRTPAHEGINKGNKFLGDSQTWWSIQSKLNQQCPRQSKDQSLNNDNKFPAQF